MFAFVLATTFMSSIAWAGSESPIGLWQNIDDVTGKPRALIRITESDGTLEGKIEKVFPGPDEDQDPTCKKCEGELKDRPIVGLLILSGMKKDGDEYAGGQILDPDNGNTYSSHMHIIEDGKKLKVRGFIGISLLGRSQIWIRKE